MKYKDYYKILGVRAHRERGRDQEGLPQARAQVPPRRLQGNRTPRRSSRRSRRPTRRCATRKSAPPTTAWAAASGRGRTSVRRPTGSTASAAAAARTCGGVDLGDLFESLGVFGRATGFGRGRGARRGPAMAFPGEDYEVPVRLTLEEAFRGTERTVQLERPQLHRAHPARRDRRPAPAAARQGRPGDERRRRRATSTCRSSSSRTRSSG